MNSVYIYVDMFVFHLSSIDYRSKEKSYFILTILERMNLRERFEVNLARSCRPLSSVFRSSTAHC